MTFQGPNELVSKLLENDQAAKRDRGPLPLSSAALKELVGVVYGASLATEEGRWPRFHVFAPSDKNTTPEIEFEEPVPLTSVGTLRKLAPAIPMDRSALLVREREGLPTALGITPVGRRGIRALPELKYSSGFYSTGLYVSVESPGTVTLSDFRQSPVQLLRLSQGRLSEPADLSGCIRWWQALGDVHGEVHQVQKLPLKPDQAKLFNDLLRDCWTRVLNEVANLGHGGAFVMPTADGTLDQLLGEVTKARSIKRRYGGLAKTVWTLIRTPPKTEEAMQRVLDAEEELKLLVPKLAHLSAVDGCVLLDRMLSPVAFGAEIVGRDEKDQNATCLSLEPQVGAPEAGDIDISTMGTRHRSAIRLCARVPAYAFVVSQDGDVRLVMHRREGVAGLCGPLVPSLITAPLAGW